MATMIVLGSLVLFLAGAVQGLAGFGSALIMVPILVLFMDPKVVIPLALLHGTFLNTVLFLTRTRSASMGKLVPLIVSGALGLPLGTMLLVTIGSDPLKVVIGVVILLSSLLLLLIKPRKKDTGLLATAAVGLTSGVLNGAISMSGPPVILAFQREGMGKREFRANLAGYFLALNLITLVIFAVTGVLTIEVWALSLLLLIPTALGLLCGMVLARSFGEGHFRIVVLVIAGASGLLSIVAGVRSILS
jgi:hypothetical protein